MRPTAAALGLILTACYSTGEGISPPLDRIYFPVGLSTDCSSRAERNASLDDAYANAGTSTDGAGAERPVDVGCDSTHLYVISSDFDLQYNAGAIQVLDLERVRTMIPDECLSADDCAVACGLLGVQTEADRVTVPGPCKPVDLQQPVDDPSRPILKKDASVEIGAFATDVVLSYGPPVDADDPLGAKKKRLLVPVRGESSLHWIDLNSDGTLDCGQVASSKRACDSRHRVGTEGTDNTRGARMPTEPFGIATSEAGDAIVITNQTVGNLTLFTQGLADAAWTSGPTIQYIHTLPALGAVAIASVPESAYVRNERRRWLEEEPKTSDPFPPGFLVAYSNAARLDLVRYYADEAAHLARPFLEEADAVTILANSTGTVSRGVAFDDADRWEREKNCLLSGDSRCMENLGEASIDVYVSSRSPAGLLVGATIPVTVDAPSRDVPRFGDVISSPIGPSRVYVGKVVDENGDLQTRIFLVCFDQREIVIYDPKRRMIEAFVRTGRGPHAMAFDVFDPDPSGGGATRGSRALAYVGHFTDSYVGVIQLDRRKMNTFGKIVLSLSTPVAPRASK
jgi:hypothetical protein